SSRFVWGSMRARAGASGTNLAHTAIFIRGTLSRAFVALLRLGREPEHLNNDLTARNDNRGKCVAGTAYARGLKNGAKVTSGQPIGCAAGRRSRADPVAGVSSSPLAAQKAGSRFSTKA